VTERAARTADAIVVPTAAVSAELARHVPLRRPPVVVGRASVVHCCPVQTPAPPGWDSRRRDYVVTLATIEHRKGLDALLEALAAPGMADVPLLVVGQAGWGSVESEPAPPHWA
jgi:hypothetical protein